MRPPLGIFLGAFLCLCNRRVVSEVFSFWKLRNKAQALRPGKHLDCWGNGADAYLDQQWRTAQALVQKHG